VKCPIDPLVDLVMAERHGIEIDYCPTCRGVWLDRGELDKIIDRNLAQAAPAAPPAPAAPVPAAPDGDRRGGPPPEPWYERDWDRDRDWRRDWDDDDDWKRYRNSDKYKKKRKSSILGEIFDF